MRHSIAVVVVCIAAGAAAAVALTGAAHRAPTGQIQLQAPGAARGPVTIPVPAAVPAPALSPAEVRATATAWVTAMWTRRPGQGPFDWLTQVAPITSPALVAQLRSALPTLNDQLTMSMSVAIDGVYPSAVDPDTLTVTCDAHIVTTTGPLDQPCATTVTVAPGPDGQPVVVDVQ